MKAAIYSRKSKFTGKGESIQNQIEICKEYGNKHFNIDEYIVYEDEGFSGGNIDRPQYKRMIIDAKEMKFHILICYRLDRISRNISNFSDIIKVLQEKDISFVSVREQFDTSTPMGRAMMYIASVFAQLERETTAERIRDNMLELAKTGRWLGGTTPTGFTSKPVYSELNSKSAKYYRLSPVKNELEKVKIIYDKYLELRSLSKLETYCMQNDIKTKNGIDYSRFGLKKILSNPVYVIADKRLYEYFINNNYEVYGPESHFNSVNGIMAYNKTLQKKNKANKPKDASEWIIAVGTHNGIISSERWIAVQNLLFQNKSKTFRRVKNTSSLLSGLLKCSNCGSYMRPKYGRILKSGEKSFYYMCEMKERSRKQKCDIKNANGNKVDRLVIGELKRMSSNSSKLYNEISNNKVSIETTQSSIHYEIEILKNNIRNNENSISNLVNTLSQGQNTGAVKYIMKQIDDIDKQTGKLKERLYILSAKVNDSQLKKQSLDIMKNMLEAFCEVIDLLDIIEKRNFIKSFIDKITWDGEYIDVVMFGSDSKRINRNVSIM